MPRRTLLPPMMSTTVTLMSSPTMNVSPIFRVRTSTRPPWRQGPGTRTWYPLDRIRRQHGDVLRLVVAHRDGRRTVVRAEQAVARRVALGQVDDLPAETLAVVDDDRREEVDRRLADVVRDVDDAVDRDLVG